jgi:hypothetical protein
MNDEQYTMNLRRLKGVLQTLLVVGVRINGNLASFLFIIFT